MLEQLAAKLLDHLYKQGVIDWFSYTVKRQEMIDMLVKVLEKELSQ